MDLGSIPSISTEWLSVRTMHLSSLGFLSKEEMVENRTVGAPDR